MTFSKSLYTEKVWNPKDVYQEYAAKLLQDNPEYWGKYSKSARMRNFWIFTKVNNKVVEVINFNRWRTIMISYFGHARICIIEGKELNMGNLIGKIHATRVERNHNRRKINFGATSKQPKVMNQEGKMVPEKIVYFVDDDWIRITWSKTNKLPNHLIYKFCPTDGDTRKDGFKEQFSKANMANPNLKLLYRFRPYKQPASL